jgi:hypothetical protein
MGVYIGARALLDINSIWLYRSPIPGGGGGGVFNRSNDFYLPSLPFGGGGQHPLVHRRYFSDMETIYPDVNDRK